MELKEAKDKFIQSWGAMGSDWGINRTMAQVHALLMISPRTLCAEEVMEELQISRGNTNMNIRALMDWGLVFKELKVGDRKEYFYAEKDMWKVVRQIILHRKKKELEPMLKILDEVSRCEGKCPESDELVKMISTIKLFSSKADTTLEAIIRADSHWFTGTFLKMIR
jgi:DNA-binding transcriptional regulator GbsR (MarR family)